MQLCRNLRWKTWSRESGDPMQIWESLSRNQVQFSCLQTCQAWGPDDDLVAPELCRKQRDCYVDDPAGGDAPDVA